MEGALFEKLKYKSCNTQNRRSDEISNRIFMTYKFFFITHSNPILNTESDMPMEKYMYIHHQNMHYHIGDIFLHCCAQFPCIDPPSPESYQHNSHVSSEILFHVYQQISLCNVHAKRPFNEKNCVNYVIIPLIH